MEWISVKEIPPTEGTYLCSVNYPALFVSDNSVNTFSPQFIIQGEFNKNYGWEISFIEFAEVSHWMPLPTPPLDNSSFP